MIKPLIIKEQLICSYPDTLVTILQNIIYFSNNEINKSEPVDKIKE